MIRNKLSLAALFVTFGIAGCSNGEDSSNVRLVQSNGDGTYTFDTKQIEKKLLEKQYYTINFPCVGRICNSLSQESLNELPYGTKNLYNEVINYLNWLSIEDHLQVIIDLTKLATTKFSDNGGKDYNKVGEEYDTVMLLDIVKIFYGVESEIEKRALEFKKESKLGKLGERELLLEELNVKNLSAEARINELEARIANMLNNLTSMELKCALVESENENSKRDNESQREIINNLELARTALLKELNSNRIFFEFEKESLEKNNKNHSLKIEKLEKEQTSSLRNIEYLEVECNRLRGELKFKNKEIERQESTHQELLRTCEDLELKAKKNCEKFDSYKESNEKMTANLGLYKGLYEKAELENKALTSKLELATKVTKKLSENNTLLAARHEEQNATIRHKLAKIMELQNKNKELEERIARFTAKS